VTNVKEVARIRRLRSAIVQHSKQHTPDQCNDTQYFSTDFDRGKWPCAKSPGQRQCNVRHFLARNFAKALNSHVQNWVETGWSTSQTRLLCVNAQVVDQVAANCVEPRLVASGAVHPNGLPGEPHPILANVPATNTREISDVVVNVVANVVVYVVVRSRAISETQEK
jgi:hypothetical protein